MTAFTKHPTPQASAGVEAAPARGASPAAGGACEGHCGTCAGHAKAGRRVVTLCDLAAGETARVVRVKLADTGCRRRFAELGLAEGMKVTVASTGETLMLVVAGAKMAMAARCACEIQVMRV